ncbi:MAG TPA: dihydroneopterin aldolase [Acidobacteriota bacterium]|nr:dihydroneopterin aldolase [Acidobacteriota bacterium]
MDSILIEGLQCQAYIGTTEDERKAPQPLSIDMELFLDLKAAGSSDDLEDTVDYLALAQRVREIVLESRFSLLERLAEELSTEILKSFVIEEIRLRLYKLPPEMQGWIRSVAVEIHRKQPTIPGAPSS